MLSVISTLLWVALAGFILGFAASTLWEWLYFRGRRLAVDDTALHADRLRELEAEIRAKDELIDQLRLEQSKRESWMHTRSGTDRPPSAEPERLEEVGPAIFPTSLQPTSSASTKDASSTATRDIGSTGPTFATPAAAGHEQSTLAEVQRAISSVAALSPQEDSNQTDRAVSDVDTGQPMISFRRGPARRTRARSAGKREAASLHPVARRTSSITEEQPTNRQTGLSDAPSSRHRSASSDASGDGGDSSTTRKSRAPHPYLSQDSLSPRPSQPAESEEPESVVPRPDHPDSAPEPTAFDIVDDGEENIDSELTERLAKEFEERERRRYSRDSQPSPASFLDQDEIFSEDSSTISQPNAPEIDDSAPFAIEESEVADRALDAEPFESDFVRTESLDGEDFSADTVTEEPANESPQFPDDLTQILGVGRVSQKRLFKEGIYTWHELTHADSKRIGKIMRTKDEAKIAGWQAQALELAQENGRECQVYNGPTPEDLEEIKGLTPKAMRLLYQEGIVTFKQLGKSRPAQIAHIVEDVPNVLIDDILKWIHRAQEIDYQSSD